MKCFSCIYMLVDVLNLATSSGALKQVNLNGGQTSNTFRAVLLSCMANTEEVPLTFQEPEWLTACWKLYCITGPPHWKGSFYFNGILGHPDALKNDVEAQIVDLLFAKYYNLSVQSESDIFSIFGVLLGTFTWRHTFQCTPCVLACLLQNPQTFKSRFESRCGRFIFPAFSHFFPNQQLVNLQPLWLLNGLSYLCDKWYNSFNDRHVWTHL